ncbi:uncharacterized protein A1O9_02404 [Exophiala aquamarina CBS 119918]|uniref:Uncharacterized protein n=1 Tax=Exophiala aquamarina CBS 119918 TaxID=1182545 RepID=A0A072PM91_9EURO|nr:uncharacterized protein A1O9_02404 [Exophiala aquamarina CBS 119918]KEF60842.1 hypothetical protein A1O9_02404 [Exophiala aquamarina CBS 119918]
MSDSTSAVYHGLENFVLDPIGVALQATIGDEQTAYNDPEKQERASLFESRTIDIWESDEGADVFPRNYPISRRLPEGLFEAFHPQVPKGRRLALRLLLTRPVLGSSQYARIDDLRRVGDRQINYLPFTATEMQRLIRQWDLNPEYVWMRLNSREVGNFYRKTSWNFDLENPEAQRMGKSLIIPLPLQVTARKSLLSKLKISIALVIHFPFVLRPARRVKYFADHTQGSLLPSRRTAKSDYNPRRDDPFIWSFAMSHSLLNGKTRGILDGVTDFAFGDVMRRLQETREPYYAHPLNVPVVLLNIFFDHIAWEISRLCVAVREFEILSRDAQISSLEDFDTITTELQYARRSLDFQLSLSKFLLETSKFLEEKIFARTVMSRDGGMAEQYRKYVFQTNPHIEEKLNNIQNLIENNLSTCQYLQSRTRDALDYIKGQIAWYDSRSSKDDAESNKTMSFLQMVFLPSTFVAAIISMNFFSFDENPPKVSGYIWIFFVVALALTASVIAIYFLWKKRSQAKEDKAETRQLKQKEEWLAARGDAGSEPSDAPGDDSYDERGHGKRRKRRRPKVSKHIDGEDGTLGNVHTREK